jgi:hypothetical protein
VPYGIRCRAQTRTVLGYAALSRSAQAVFACPEQRCIMSIVGYSAGHRGQDGKYEWICQKDRHLANVDCAILIQGTRPPEN